MLTVGNPKSLDNKGITAMPEPFVFVPITHSEAAKGRGAAKRIVRAHVTRVQHAKSNAVGNHMELQSWTVKPYIHRSHNPVRRKQRAIDTAPILRTEKPKHVPATSTSTWSVVPDSSSSSGSSRKNSSSQSSDPDAPLEENPPQAIILARPALPTGGSSEDPFWTFPVDYQPALSPIFAHYIQNVAVEIPDIDGPNAKGLLRRVWFPLCMTEAATMYAVLLMAASHYCVMNPHKAALVDLLALKARALSEINMALADPTRAVTDAMIGAVMKMAAYEAVFGDTAVFTAHMKGLQMMLKMRGGLATLGLDGLLERMCVWIDLNACFITGMEKFLGTDALTTVVEFAAPDPYHFAGIQ